MICEHCGCFFCDDFANPGTSPKRFCDPHCAKNASAKRSGLKKRKQLKGRAKRTERKIDNRCRRKVRYDTAMDALVEALRQRHDWGHAQAHTYECRDCGGWHLTTKPPRRRRVDA